jgi:hypothetical protein
MAIGKKVYHDHAATASRSQTGSTLDGKAELPKAGAAAPAPDDGPHQ